MLVIGCDWARSKHDFVLMTADGGIIESRSVAHDPEALDELAQLVAQHEPIPAEVHVGIESHDGPLLAWLLEQGYTVYGINPKSAERAREIYRPAGSKDDPGDGYVHAELVRTNRGHFKPLASDSPTTQELRSWYRLRQRQVQQRTAVFQQLRTLLAEWHPALSQLCKDFNAIWQRDLLAECPTHHELRQMHGNRLNAFCRSHRLGQTTRQRLLNARKAPELFIPPARQEVIRTEILLLVESAQRLVQAIRRIDEKLRQLAAQHPDAEIFQSLPVSGTQTVSALLAAFGEDRENAPAWEVLAARWGVAPITKQSGKSRLVHRRAACDHDVNQSLLFFAFNTAFKDGCWAADYYQRKRAEGKEHYTALRCLAQRWVKILYRIWMNRTPYDEQLHQANRKRAAA